MARLQARAETSIWVGMEKTEIEHTWTETDFWRNMDGDGFLEKHGRRRIFRETWTETDIWRNMDGDEFLDR